MLTKEQLVSEIARLGKKQAWWHDIQLADGVRTLARPDRGAGENTEAVKWNRIETLLDYRGKSVIDVPCNDGFYSVQLLAQGAAKVLATDIDADRIEKACFVKEQLQMNGMDIRQANVYELPKIIEGRYDIALCLGLLHRVPNPYGLMEVMLQVADTVVVEWPALLSRRADARFWKPEVKDDFYNTGYWELSRKALTNILQRLGAENIIDCAPYSKRAIFVVTSSSQVAAQVRAKVEKPTATNRWEFKKRALREATSTFLTNVGLIAKNTD